MTLLAMVTASRVQIDGREVLIIQTPYHPLFATATEAMARVSSLFNAGSLVFQVKTGERIGYMTSGVVTPEQVRALEPFTWTKIPIYAETTLN